MIQPFNLIDISDLYLGKKRPKSILKKMNDIEKTLTYIISMVICSLRTWDGLPKELEKRKYIIEYLLFWYGQAVLIKRNDLYLFLPCYQSSELNIYGEGTRYYAYGLNGTSFGEVYVRDKYDLEMNLTNKQDAVLFRNNTYNIPQYFFMRPLIARLVYIWQSMGIQNGLNRIKLLIYANTGLSGKIKDVIDDIINNEDITCVVPTEASTSLLEDVKETNFGGEYNPDENWTDFDKTFNLLLSLSGVKTNAEQNKKERQTRTEITSKDLFTEQCKYTSNQMRDIAIDECKEIFGLNLSYKDVVEEKIKKETIEYAKAFTGGEGGEGLQKSQNQKDDFKNTGVKK